MVNTFYEQEGMTEQIRQALQQDPALPVVALGQFLSEEEFATVQKDTTEGWQHSTIPDRYSYATHKVQISGLREFVQQIAGSEPLQETSKQFGHRDFTLLHDNEEQQPGILAFLFLDDFPEEYGGQLVFMKDGELLGRFTPQANTLLIVERKKGVQYFVQYVNHYAGETCFRWIAA